jgi:hypothetical protein
MIPEAAVVAVQGAWARIHRAILNGLCAPAVRHAVQAEMLPDAPSDRLQRRATVTLAAAQTAFALRQGLDGAHFQRPNVLAFAVPAAAMRDPVSMRSATGGRFTCGRSSLSNRPESRINA